MSIFDFTRNCPRSEFWLVQVLGSLTAFMCIAMMTSSVPGSLGVWIGLVALLAIVVAQLATLVSRIRDTGNNVLWLLACFIPYLGLIAWIIFGCLESKKA